MANAVHQMIGEEAARQGVDQALALATAAQESNFNPFAQARTSTAFGLYQFIDANWRDYGIQPRSPQTRDPSVQIRLGIDRIRKNRDGLSVFLGRSPEPSEVYLAHVFGLNGAQQILGHGDDTPIGLTRPQAVFDANQWIAANGIRTVGDMRAHFRRTVDRRLTEARGLLDPAAALTPPTPGGRPAVGSEDITSAPASGAQWPLHRFIPDDERLRPSARAAGALEAVGAELGEEMPQSVSEPPGSLVAALGGQWPRGSTWTCLRSLPRPARGSSSWRCNKGSRPSASHEKRPMLSP